MKKLSSILIIDDDPTTGFLQKKLITNFEVTHKVEVAEGGEEALQLITNYIHSQHEDQIPQLIFVDLNMPFMSGFEFLEAYEKLNFKTKDSVVVSVLTSSFSNSDIKRIKKFPIVADYVVKPLNEEKMMRIMQQHFGWEPVRD